MAGVRRASMRLEGAELALEAQHGGGDEGAAEQVAGVAEQEAGGEIVGAVADEVVARDQLAGGGGVHAQRVGFDADFRVQRGEGFGRAFGLVAADAGGAVDHLALEVGKLQRVVVHEADRADAGGGEVEGERRAKAAGAHHQHPRGAEPRLALGADLGEEDVAGVAVQLGVGEVEVHGADMVPGMRIAAARARRADQAGEASGLPFSTTKVEVILVVLSPFRAPWGVPGATWKPPPALMRLSGWPSTVSSSSPSRM